VAITSSQFATVGGGSHFLKAFHMSFHFRASPRHLRIAVSHWHYSEGSAFVSDSDHLHICWAKLAVMRL
jgi:hypothetical protein